MLPWQHILCFLGLKILFLWVLCIPNFGFFRFFGLEQRYLIRWYLATLHSKSMHGLEQRYLIRWYLATSVAMATLFSVSWTYRYFYSFFYIPYRYREWSWLAFWHFLATKVFYKSWWHSTILLNYCVSISIGYIIRHRVNNRNILFQEEFLFSIFKLHSQKMKQCMLQE